MTDDTPPSNGWKHGHERRRASTRLLFCFAVVLPASLAVATEASLDGLTLQGRRREELADLSRTTPESPETVTTLEPPETLTTLEPSETSPIDGPPETPETMETATSETDELATLDIPPLFSGTVGSGSGAPTSSPVASESLNIPPLFPPVVSTSAPTSFPTLELMSRGSPASPAIPLPPYFPPDDARTEDGGEQFLIRMILTLHYVTNVTEAALGRPLDEDAIHYRFCSAVKEQSAGVQAAYWAARDSLRLYTRPNDETDGCTVLGTNRLYVHGNGGYGDGYFSLEVDLTQRVSVEPLGTANGVTADEANVAVYVHKGFGFGGGGRRKFINLLRRTNHGNDNDVKAAHAFQHVVDATVRSGMLSPPMAPPTAAPTLTPTMGSTTSSPRQAPSAVPSEVPSRVPVAFPALSPTASPVATPKATLAPTTLTAGAPGLGETRTLTPTHAVTGLPTSGDVKEGTAAPTKSNDEYDMNSTRDGWQQEDEATAVPSSRPSSHPSAAVPSSHPSAAVSSANDTADVNSTANAVDDGDDDEDDVEDDDEDEDEQQQQSPALFTQQKSRSSLHPLVVIGSAGVVIGLALLACAVIVICRRPRQSLSWSAEDKSGYSSRGEDSELTKMKMAQKKKKKTSMEDAVVVRKKRKSPVTDVAQDTSGAPKKDIIVDANSMVDSSVGELTADGGRSGPEAGYSSCGFESEAESSLGTRTNSGHWRAGGGFFGGGGGAASVVSSVAYTEAGNYSLDHGIREDETILGPDGKPRHPHQGPRPPKSTTQPDEEATPRRSNPVDLDESVAGTVNSAEDMEAGAAALVSFAALQKAVPSKGEVEEAAILVETSTAQKSSLSSSKKPSLASCIMPKCIFGAPVDLDDSFRTLDTTTSVSTPPRRSDAATNTTTPPPPPSSSASSSHHPDLDELERQFQQQPRSLGQQPVVVPPPLLPPLLPRTTSKVDEGDMAAGTMAAANEASLSSLDPTNLPPTPPTSRPKSPGWAAAFAAGTAAILTASLGRCSPSLDVARCSSPTPVVVDGVESEDEESPPLAKKGEHSPVNALSSTDTTSQSTRGEVDEDDPSTGSGAFVDSGAVEPSSDNRDGREAATPSRSVESPHRRHDDDDDKGRHAVEEKEESPTTPPLVATTTMTTATTMESSPESTALESISDLGVPSFASWHISPEMKATATRESPVLEVPDRELDESERDDRSTMEKDRMIPIQEQRHLSTPSQDEAEYDEEDDDDDRNRKNNPWLFGTVTDTLGAPNAASDWASLGGRSAKSCPMNGGGTKGASVTRELLALERQLSLLGSQRDEDSMSDMSTDLTTSEAASVASTPLLASHGPHSVGPGHGPATASPRCRSRLGPSRTLITLKAPPGRLGAVMANRSDGRGGTVVSALRSTSPLTGKLKPGDRIMAVDDEDVSHVTVSELTAIMGRKADKERILTVLTFSNVRPTEMAL